MSNHDYWLEPPEECGRCGLVVCECDWEAERADREYKERREQA